MRQLIITNSITNKESLSLVKYLQEINKIPMISAEEEARLGHLIQNGDRNALDSLVKANLRFVVSVAKQYQHKGIPLSDLINEGNMGLIKAARNYDATRGMKFISYAVWWIRQTIVQSLAENSRLIRLPMNKVALRSHVQKAGSLLEQNLQRSASSEEIAELLNRDVEEVDASLSMSSQPVSLDDPLSSEEEGCLIDVIVNPNADGSDSAMQHTHSLKTEIDRTFRVLNEKQRLTLCYLYGIGIDYPLSLETIAEKFNLSMERVRQIKEKAIQKIQATANCSVLRSYLGN